MERVTSTKLLGVHMQEHLTWNIHINELVTSCYGALAVLKKLRNLAPFPVKKQLVESLILYLSYIMLVECSIYCHFVSRSAYKESKMYVRDMS